MRNSITKNHSLYFLGIIFIIVLWWILSIVIKNDLVIPSIKNVLESLMNLLKTKKTYEIILNTIYRLIISLVIAFLVSFVLSLVSFLFKEMKEFLLPLITLIRTIPVATIIIILLMLVGNKNSPYIICMLVIVPIMYEANLNGFYSIDKGVLEEVKMQSKTNFLVIKDIYVPLVFPHLLSGIVASFGLGLKVMVMAEFIAQTPNTIGYILNQEKVFLEINNVFAWTIILIIFMMLVEVGLKIIQNRIVKNYS